ncbi:myo-inositol-1(or 4)-monophosphatase [Streptomyces achromogenes]|uniref:inositol monophosphatase family protein n=1 Tax=Streptomyces achromogenes TaxID=67255 RepID=UPI00277D3D6A|nr:inositol monophosphatase family protein [Streptomyces achromogenes]MDQ0835757.1 myo-inositol-1(or 4)-monophosphatase [Streptomyces achromogenes]
MPATPAVPATRAVPATPAVSADDAEILARTADAVRDAASALRERFGDVVRHETREELMRALAVNDDLALGILRPRLSQLRPNARWVEEELEGGALPPGEWWVVDPAEGNVNHLHALPEWAVTATLVRDNLPVLTAVHLPSTGETYTALAGAGARVDGRPLRVSPTADLGLSIVATSQARPDEPEEVVRRIGASITAMLLDALVVRTAVPATLHLLHVAAGRIDAFWQFAGARADLLPGALLVTEAGGRISDVEGRPWTPQSESFLAAAPAMHTAAVATLGR